MLSTLKNKLPSFLGGTRKLKPEENAEAISLAALKGVEVLAQMMIRSNGLLSTNMMAAQFRSAAISTSQQAKTHKERSLERVGLEFMATQMSDVADNLIYAENNNKKKNNESI